MIWNAAFLSVDIVSPEGWYSQNRHFSFPLGLVKEFLKVSGFCVFNSGFLKISGIKKIGLAYCLMWDCGLLSTSYCSTFDFKLTKELQTSNPYHLRRIEISLYYFGYLVGSCLHYWLHLRFFGIFLRRRQVSLFWEAWTVWASGKSLTFPILTVHHTCVIPSPPTHTCVYIYFIYL